LRRSNLIEERLKLMVVMLVHERNMDLLIPRQLLSASDPGESAADDHYMFYTHRKTSQQEFQSGMEYVRH